MWILVSFVEISFSSMRVVSMVFLYLSMRNCSHWLKFETQHEGIEISNAVDMSQSRVLFPNYVRMIDFIMNSCLIQQIQGATLYCSIWFIVVPSNSSKTNLI